MERANAVRLLLLPIPRATLYVAQASGALADPWTLVALPVALFLPLGLAIGGALQAAMIAFAAGLTFLAVIVGLSTLTALIVQLVVRDRRRGELVTLAFLLIIPILGMLGGGIERNDSRHGQPHGTPPVERSGPGAPERIARRVFALIPSERYVAATRAAAQGRPGPAVAAWVSLATIAAALHGAALFAFFRVLTFPGSMSRRRSSPARDGKRLRIPGLSPGASAVAMAQLRLVMRTARGRSTVLSPLIGFIVLAVISSRGGVGVFSLLPRNGAGLAAVGAFFGIIATLPLAMNQFAIDGAGLTLQLLSPLSDDDLLNGKAVANGVLAGALTLLCMLVALLVYPGGSLALWISVPLAAAAMLVLLAPVAAALSAIFPRAVDLNSAGRGSNAHGVAGLVGFAAIGLAGLPPAALAVLAIRGLQRPELTPLLMLVWCAVVFGINRLLARPLRALLARRRENLGIVVG